MFEDEMWPEEPILNMPSGYDDWKLESPYEEEFDSYEEWDVPYDMENDE